MCFLSLKKPHEIHFKSKSVTVLSLEVVVDFILHKESNSCSTASK